VRKEGKEKKHTFFTLVSVKPPSFFSLLIKSERFPPAQLIIKLEIRMRKEGRKRAEEGATYYS
jgi:hypothetical protein